MSTTKQTTKEPNVATVKITRDVYDYALASVYRPATTLHAQRDPKRCSRSVYREYRYGLGAQCSRKAVVFVYNYGWCKQHAPKRLEASGER